MGTGTPLLPGGPTEYFFLEGGGISDFLGDFLFIMELQRTTKWSVVNALHLIASPETDQSENFSDMQILKLYSIWYCRIMS